MNVCSVEGVSIETVSFGSRIRKLRKERGWTQVELANQAHLHPQAVIRWELESRSPTVNSLRSIAAAFEMTMAELLTGVE